MRSPCFPRRFFHSRRRCRSPDDSGLSRRDIPNRLVRPQPIWKSIFFTDRSSFSPFVFFVVKCLDFQPRRTRGTRRYSSPKSATIKKNRTATARWNSTKPILANMIPTATALATQKRMRTETAQGTPENPPPWTMTASTRDWKERSEQQPCTRTACPRCVFPSRRTNRTRRTPLRFAPSVAPTPQCVLRTPETVFFVPAYDRVKPPAFLASNDPVALIASKSRTFGDLEPISTRHFLRLKDDRVQPLKSV